MLDGEVGPFIIRGAVTEFSETAEMEGSKKGFNSRRLGVGTAIIGGITGNRTAAAVGTGVAVAGPEYQKQEMNRTGMVGMDLRIVDGRVARTVRGGAFDCQGSFTSIATGTDFGMLGFSSGRTASASSSLGQATRAAMNDALVKISDALKTVR
jgi:curli biogenesis system outer membrane secretion channel CsgG